jgi:hypothetical protein
VIGGHCGGGGQLTCAEADVADKSVIPTPARARLNHRRFAISEPMSISSLHRSQFPLDTKIPCDMVLIGAPVIEDAPAVPKIAVAPVNACR